MRKRTTIKDLASVTGVSAAAVSAVLSGKSGVSIRVSDTTRKKIIQAARRLEYVPDQRAKSLRERCSSIITVITYEKVFPVDWRNEFYGFFVGIEEEAARLNYDILILNNRPDSSTENTDRISRLGLADGAVVIGINREEKSLLRFLRSGFPLLFVGRRNIGGLETHYTTFDYETPVRNLVRRIAHSNFPGIVFFASGEGEPLIDKRAVLVNESTNQALDFREIAPFGAQFPINSSWFRDVLHNNFFLIFNTMEFADTFKEQAHTAGYIAGMDYQAAVLEDRWQDNDNFWMRLDSDRVQLGRVAIASLVDIISEKISTPIQRLIPVHLVDGKSARLDQI